MTVSDLDRLHSQLSKLEDMFPGYVTEIVEGSIVMNPVRPFHGRTIQRLWGIVEEQLTPEWALVTDVAFFFDEANEFCPDLAVIPAAAETENRGSYPADLIEFVAEVVSPESVRRDYTLKPLRYASRGIPNYLVVNPLEGHVVTMWNPGPEGYRGRDTIPYGPEIKVDSPLGRLVIPTSDLPVDPKAPHPS
ncbi:Uma2 family endonuclease [Streptomyces sp. NPDC056161]|uniref:Uma2 family endonuclease n=1 Tax=unclassified Streptomyces TaxID=2593676 RepID=UPI0035D905BC